MGAADPFFALICFMNSAIGGGFFFITFTADFGSACGNFFAGFGAKVLATGLTVTAGFVT